MALDCPGDADLEDSEFQAAEPDGGPQEEDDEGEEEMIPDAVAVHWKGADPNDIADELGI